MDKTKIQLSEDELLLMRNSEWILTKNRILEKISYGFSRLAVQMQQRVTFMQHKHDENIVLSSPKISRGEKYQGLPYLILDYPRLFGKENILAIRTLFWWGNYCSITLHIKGIWQEVFLSNIIAFSNQSTKTSFYISFSGDEWNHNLLNEDYSALINFSQEELQKELPGKIFIKLAAKIEIEPWDTMEQKLFELFLYLAEIIES